MVLTLGNSHFDWHHYVSIHFFDPNPINIRILNLEICYLHHEHTSWQIRYAQPVFIFRFCNTIGVPQNVTAISRGSSAPVLVAEQEFTFVSADNYEFSSNMGSDFSFIALELKACCKIKDILVFIEGKHITSQLLASLIKNHKNLKMNYIFVRVS